MKWIIRKLTHMAENAFELDKIEDKIFDEQAVASPHSLGCG